MQRLPKTVCRRPHRRLHLRRCRHCHRRHWRSPGETYWQRWSPGETARSPPPARPKAPPRTARVRFGARAPTRSPVQAACAHRGSLEDRASGRAARTARRAAATRKDRARLCSRRCRHCRLLGLPTCCRRAKIQTWLPHWNRELAHRALWSKAQSLKVNTR